MLTETLLPNAMFYPIFISLTQDATEIGLCKNNRLGIPFWVLIYPLEAQNSWPW
jgi:hypothetical protein